MKKYYLLFALLIVANFMQAQITTVNLNATVNAASYPPGDSTYYDINNDGTVDFSVLGLDQPAAPQHGFIIQFFAGNAGQINPGSFNESKVLNSGDEVSASGTFAGGKNSPSITGVGLNYNAFDGAGDKYIGLRFSFSGNLHYGWMLVNVAADGRSMQIKTLAWEQTADAPIKAGQTVGIAENATQPIFQLFPNPASQNQPITFLFNSNNEKQISVFDVTGKLIFSQQSVLSSVLLPTNNWSKGIYLIEVVEHHKKWVEKLIIK